MSSDGWYAHIPTFAGGKFQFSLGEGFYKLKLADADSDVASFTINEQTRLEIEFREKIVS